MKIRIASLCLAIFLTSSPCFAASADGAWLKKVPIQEHNRTNPYAGQEEATTAGRHLYGEHCAQCHGHNAEGNRKRPSLLSERVQRSATDGDLHWLLVNGSMARGMPSWSKLGDPQIWQIIRYLKSLQR